MKFYKKELLNAHNKIKSAVDNKALISVFKTVRFIAKDGVFRLIGQNSVYQIEATGECEGDDNFDLCLPSDKFGIMISASQDVITITNKDSAVSTQSGRSKFKFASFSGDDYPLINRIESEVVKVNLREIIGRVHLCVNHSDVRDYLRGVSLISDGEIVTATGTNGHMVASLKTQIKTNEFDIIVPADVAAICADCESESMSIDGKRSIEIVFKDGTILVSKLIDGKFPDIDRVISFDAPLFFEVDGKEFKASISTAQKLGLYVKLNNKDGVMQVSSQDSEMISDIESKGEDINISFLVDYLKKSIDISGLNQLSFNFTKDMDRIKLTEGGLTIVVMMARL